MSLPPWHFEVTGMKCECHTHETKQQSKQWVSKGPTPPPPRRHAVGKNRWVFFAPKGFIYQYFALIQKKTPCTSATVIVERIIYYISRQRSDSNIAENGSLFRTSMRVRSSQSVRKIAEDPSSTCLRTGQDGWMQERKC